MADSYVCSGATMRCTMGEMEARLTVLPIRTVSLCGKPMANISDHTSMVNLAPFGRCRSLGYPATASATAAHHGVLTPMPCMHNTPMPWMNGKNDYLIKGQPALLKSCKCTCIWGGTISITNDGQTDTGSADLSRESRDTAEQMELSGGTPTGFTADTVLDGIQMALDVAGFAPGVGAFADLTNAAIYAARGDTTNAALSLIAAVPGIGDAAAATKIVSKGVKMAKGTEKAAGATTKVIKTGKKMAEASTKSVNVGEKVTTTIAKTEKGSSKSAQLSEKETLQQVRLKKLGPDAKIGGSEKLYDTAQETTKQPKFLEITQKKAMDGEKTSGFDSLTKGDQWEIKNQQTWDYIGQETKTSSNNIFLQESPQLNNPTPIVSESTELAGKSVEINQSDFNIQTSQAEKTNKMLNAEKAKEAYSKKPQDKPSLDIEI